MGTHVGCISCISHEVLFHGTHVANLEDRGQNKTIQKKKIPKPPQTLKNEMDKRKNEYVSVNLLALEAHNIKNHTEKRSALASCEVCHIWPQKNDIPDIIFKKNLHFLSHKHHSP